MAESLQNLVLQVVERALQHRGYIVTIDPLDATSGHIAVLAEGSLTPLKRAYFEVTSAALTFKAESGRGERFAAHYFGGTVQIEQTIASVIQFFDGGEWTDAVSDATRHSADVRSALRGGWRR